MPPKKGPQSGGNSVFQDVSDRIQTSVSNVESPDSESTARSGGSWHRLVNMAYSAQTKALSPGGSNALGMRSPTPVGKAPTPSLDPRAAVEKVAGNNTKPEPKPPEKSDRSNATSYDSQPAALREVLERSFPENAWSVFSALSDANRSNLTYTYNRMVDHGLWGHVRFIRGFVDGEKPVKIGPLELHVAGKSESILFEVYDAKALRDTMLTSGKFGKDSGPTGALHPGQDSMREWTTVSTDGLHLSVGPGNAADAHIDKKSPTNAPKRQTSQMDLVRSLEHHWQEVWPEFLRLTPGWIASVPKGVYDWLVDKTQYLGVGKTFRAALKQIPESLFRIVAHAVGLGDALYAGTTFKPADKVKHPDPSQREKGSDIVVIKEYRFGKRGKKARKPVAPPVEQSSMTEDIQRAVQQAVVAVNPGIIKPSGKKGARGDFAEAEAVGEAMAGKILYQAKKGGISFGLELGAVYHDLNQTEVKDVKDQLVLIGKAVRETMIAKFEATDDVLARAISDVRSGLVQLGPSLVPFSVH